MRAAGDELERRTDGRVELRFYPGGVMGNDRSVMRKIRIGQLQGGMVTVGALADANRDIQVYGTPFLFRSLEEVDFVRRNMDAELLAQLEKDGFVSFGFGEAGFAYLLSNQPVRTVEDVKHRKVWVPEGDRISLTAMKALEISPVSLPVTDVLTGLQTSLIDTVASPPVGAIALQWHTRVRYMTDVPLLYTYGILVIQNKAFRRLGARDQKIAREVLAGAFDRINQQIRRDNEQAKTALARQGIAFIKPPRSDLEKWRNKVHQAMAKLEAEGFFSKPTVAKVRRLLDQYRSR
jgi:TRAP-type C4-dicarboxylate transport system substrate-binding protein